MDCRTARLLCPWEFSRKEYWSGLPCPLPRGFSKPKDLIQICNPELQLDSLLFEPPGKPKNTRVGSLSLLQRIFPVKELNWGLLQLQEDSLPAELPGKPQITYMVLQIYFLFSFFLCFARPQGLWDLSSLTRN